MNETLMYFLKVNIAIALFYLFYRLFFAGDTFWKTRRYYMLLSVLISFVHPFLSVENWLDKQESVKTIVVNYAMLPEFTVTPVQQTNWLNTENILIGIYALGALFLLTKMLVQLGAILRMKMQGHKQLVQGISIIALEKEVTPFSFFNAVFMNPALHNEHETREILAHEMTHVRQWHSFDVLVSELLTIVFWFNPATWLLKGEIRQNLEFLADNKVIESGFDSKAYQYHLLQLTYQTPEIKLANKFNVSPLKKRIIMMNQKKSAKASLLKYSLIVPLALVLVISSNAQTVVNKAKKALNSKELVTEQKAVKSIPKKTAETTKKAVETVKPLPETIKAPDRTMELTDPVITVDSTKVYEVIEKMPQYPGGESELLKFISQNIKYPVIAQQNGIQGRVIVRFVVSSTGKVSNIEVLRSLDPSCDKEAVRVIKMMADWVPGEQKGQKVSVYYTLPITFKLQSQIALDSFKKNQSITANTVVEKMPQFPGGDAELMRFISKNIKYPVKAQESGTQGMLLVRFIVNNDGKVINATVLKNILKTTDKKGVMVVGYGRKERQDSIAKVNVDAVSALENEALRVVNTMPEWIPGEQGGAKVPVYYTMPITFKLQ